MTDKKIAEGFARARDAVNTMTLTINEAGEKIRKAYADAARKINAAMKVRQQ